MSNEILSAINKKINSEILGSHISMPKKDFKSLVARIEDSELYIAENYHETYRYNYERINLNWNKKAEMKGIELDPSEEFKIAFQMEADLMFKDPRINVKPEKDTPNFKAKVTQSVLTKEWEISKATGTTRGIIRDAICSFGCGFVGYETNAVRTPDEIDVDDYLKIIEAKINTQIKQLGEATPEMLEEFEQAKKNIGIAKEKNQSKIQWIDDTIVDGHAYLMRIRPYNYIFDRYASCKERNLFEGYTYSVSKDDLMFQFPELKKHFGKKYDKSTGEYDNKTNDFESKDDISGYTREDVDDDNGSLGCLDSVKLYRMFYWKYDKYGNRRVAEILFTEGYDKPLINKFCDIPYLKLPMQILGFFFDNENQLPIPIISVIRDWSLMLKANMNKLFKTLSSVHDKYAVDKRALEDEDVEYDLTSPEDGFVKFDVAKLGLTSINQVIQPLVRNTQKIQLLSDTLGLPITKIEEIAGLSKNKQAQQGNSTATESLIIQQNVSRLMNRNSIILDDFISSVVNDMYIVVNEKFTDEDYIEIEGDNLAPEKIKYNPDDLNGLFSIKIEAGSTSKNDVEIKRQQDLQFYNFIIQSPYANRYYLDTWMARSMGMDEADINKSLLTPDDMNADKEFNILMTNIGLMLSGQEVNPEEIMPLPRENEDYDKHLQTHNSQMETLKIMPIEDQIKIEMAKFLEQHIMMTEEMKQQTTGKKTPQMNNFQTSVKDRQAVGNQPQSMNQMRNEVTGMGASQQL